VEGWISLCFQGEAERSGGREWATLVRGEGKVSVAVAVAWMRSIVNDWIGIEIAHLSRFFAFLRFRFGLRIGSGDRCRSVRVQKGYAGSQCVERSIFGNDQERADIELR
jgi:hypothetical protein